MRKHHEIGLSDSCLNKATEGEMLFVLLGRDEAAPATIRFWVGERVRLGKNSISDFQLEEALECANTMEQERTTPAR